MNFKRFEILALSNVFEDLYNPDNKFYLSLEVSADNNILLVFKTDGGLIIREILFSRVYKNVSPYIFVNDHYTGEKLVIALIQNEAILLNHLGDVILRMPFTSFKDIINRFNEVLQCQLKQN